MTQSDEKYMSQENNNTAMARIAELGISPEEYTPAVSLAISALLEKIHDNEREIFRLREHVSELEALVDVDCLVPIPNRRAFMRRLNWAVSMCTRYNHQAAVLFIDLNNMKEINDQYGHAAGDAAIRHAAGFLRQAIRESDFLARIGGDEFAVLLHYVEAEEAHQKGNQIAELLRQNPMQINGRSIMLHAAVGCHVIQSGDDAERALSAADTAMYVEKRRMKNESASASVTA